MKISIDGVVRDMTAKKEAEFLVRTAPEDYKIEREFKKRMDAAGYSVDEQLTILRSGDSTSITRMNSDIASIESKRDALLSSRDRDYNDDSKWS